MLKVSINIACRFRLATDGTTKLCYIKHWHTGEVPWLWTSHVHHKCRLVHSHSMGLLARALAALGIIALRNNSVQAKPSLRFEPCTAALLACRKHQRDIQHACHKALHMTWSRSIIVPCTITAESWGCSASHTVPATLVASAVLVSRTSMLLAASGLKRHYMALN